MIHCNCIHCPVPCGKTFETVEEYRKFCYEKFVERHPDSTILSRYTPEEK